MYFKYLPQNTGDGSRRLYDYDLHIYSVLLQLLSSRIPITSRIHANIKTIKISGTNICIIVPSEKQVIASPKSFILCLFTDRPSHLRFTFSTYNMQNAHEWLKLGGFRICRHCRYFRSIAREVKCFFRNRYCRRVRRIR